MSQRVLQGLRESAVSRMSRTVNYDDGEVGCTESLQPIETESQRRAGTTRTMTALIDTAEAAARLGISRRRVLALIEAGRLPAQRLGARTWGIKIRDLAKVAERTPGWPVGRKRA